jgi:uncharacterized protein
MVRIICREDIAGKTLVAGFVGLGHVGFLSIDHAINALKAKKVGFIETLYIPPIVTVRGETFTTPYEIYSSGDTLFFRCESIPSGKSGNQILRSFTYWAKRGGIGRMILIGGLSMAFKREGEKHDVRYLYNKYYRERFGEPEPTVQEGVQVIGPLAILIYYTELMKIPSIAILSYADSNRVDPRGAANAVIDLSKLLNTEIDVQDLLERASMIEKEMEGLMASMEEDKRSLRDSDMYA